MPDPRPLESAPDAGARLSIIVLGDGILAAALAGALGARHAVTWIRRTSAPPACPALAAPGTPADWQRGDPVTAARAAVGAAWLSALVQNARRRVPLTLLPVIAPNGVAVPDLRLAITDIQAVWRAAYTLARQRARIVRAAAAAPHIANGRCIGVQTRRRRWDADLVIATRDPRPAATLWLDPSPPPTEAVWITPDADHPTGWRVQFPAEGGWYTTQPARNGPLPGVTPLPGGERRTGITITPGLITVTAPGSHGMSALPTLVSALTALTGS